MMNLIVVVLMSLTSQLASGNPFIFPDEVSVNSNGVWTLKTSESKLEENEYALGITNTSAKVENEMFPSENETSSEVSDQGEEYIGNKKINKTDLLPFVEGIDSNFLKDEIIKISTDNTTMRKSKDKKFGSDLDVTPKDNTGITLVRNLKRRAMGKQIFFPNQRIPVQSSPVEGPMNIPNSPMIGPCRDGYIHYQGECSQLLSSKPCTENWWLVMKGHGFAECEPRPCPLGQIYFQNTCVYPEHSNICADGQILYVELTGEAFCDCESDYFYNIIDGTCVPEYSQGSCNWGHYIVKNIEGIPECVQNPCVRDIFVYHEQHKLCYSKSFVGFCEQKNIQINGNEAGCKDDVALDLRNIFEVPTLRRCPRGSLRDILHTCRRRFTVPSISSVLNSQRIRGRCPTGSTKGPRGRCKKIRNLFSI